MKNPKINRKFSDGLGFISDLGRSSELGEVFTPLFIVNKILGFAGLNIEHSSKKIFEPACGHGNFGVEIIHKKIKAVIREMLSDNVGNDKWTEEYEIRTILAIGSLYQNDIDFQNIQELKGRLSRFIFDRYKKHSKNPHKEIPTHYDVAVSSILSNNCFVCDMLSKKHFKTQICFYKRMGINSKKIARIVVVFEEIIKNGKPNELSLFDDEQKIKITTCDIVEFDKWEHLINGIYNINYE